VDLAPARRRDGPGRPSPRPPSASAESIEQDGFAGAGFAGQHRKATGRKLDIEPFDQDDVTDRKTRQACEIYS